MTEAENYVAGIPMWTGKKNSVADVRRFLDELGGPDRGMRVVHVAGTNGKGSVCAYLTQAFLDSGLHTGTFVSPHLVSIRERILLDNVPVDEARFASAVQKVRAEGLSFERRGGAFPSNFEFLYYMAMLLFREAGVDVILLETGLGGRLDATNSCLPLLTVLTSISRDHMLVLGDTIAKIAAEKAGIIKPGVPVVFDRNSEEAAAVILKRAAETGSEAYPVLPLPENAAASDRTAQGAGHSCPAGGEDMDRSFSFLPAAYQRENARVALEAWRVLRALPAFREPLLEPEEAFAVSVQRTHWTGRMDEIRPDIFLDGGHNEDGVRAMAEAGRTLCRSRGKKPVLVTSAVSDKDLSAVVRNMVSLLQPVRVYISPLMNPRSADAGTLSRLYRENGVRDVRLFPTAAEAWERALAEKNGDEILFGAGSLYLVREILIEEGRR